MHIDYRSLNEMLQANKIDLFSLSRDPELKFIRNRKQKGKAEVRTEKKGKVTTYQ